MGNVGSGANSPTGLSSLTMNTNNNPHALSAIGDRPTEPMSQF